MLGFCKSKVYIEIFSFYLTELFQEIVFETWKYIYKRKSDMQRNMHITFFILQIVVAFFIYEKKD